MATANPVSGLQGPLGAVKKITGWYIAAAVLFIVLGIFCKHRLGHRDSGGSEPADDGDSPADVRTGCT